jgi:hypothetical protein
MQPTFSFEVQTVPDHGSRDRDVVLVTRTISLGKPQGVGNLEWGWEWGGNGEGEVSLEQPGAKVDKIASPQRGFPSK